MNISAKSLGSIFFVVLNNYISNTELVNLVYISYCQKSWLHNNFSICIKMFENTITIAAYWYFDGIIRKKYISFTIGSPIR